MRCYKPYANDGEPPKTSSRLKSPRSRRIDHDHGPVELVRARRRPSRTISIEPTDGPHSACISRTGSPQPHPRLPAAGRHHREDRLRLSAGTLPVEGSAMTEGSRHKESPEGLPTQGLSSHWGSAPVHREPGDSRATPTAARRGAQTIGRSESACAETRDVCRSVGSARLSCRRSPFDSLPLEPFSADETLPAP